MKNLQILFFSSSLRLLALSGFLIVYYIYPFKIMIASAFEAQGFQETLKCHCLGSLSFPLPFRLPLSLYI